MLLVIAGRASPYDRPTESTVLPEGGGRFDACIFWKLT